MSAYRQGQTIYLFDSTGQPRGMLGLDGREWAFPAAMLATSSAAQLVGDLVALFDPVTFAPVGYLGRDGQEYGFPTALTLNTTVGWKMGLAAELFTAAGAPAGLYSPSTWEWPTALVANGGGGGGLSLPQLGALVAKFSADAITPQADNTNLVTWTDSINGAAATQATGGLQPKYRTNRMGGLPSVQFPGTAVLSAGRPTALMAALDQITSNTYMVVYKTLGAANSNAMLMAAADGNGGGIMVVGDGAKVGMYAQNVPSTGGTFMSVAQSSTNSVAGGGTVCYRTAVNGCVVNPTQNETPTSSTFNFQIGGITGKSFFANADIYEIWVWSVALTPVELLQAHAYACSKYSQPVPWLSVPYFLVCDGDSITMGSGAAGSGSYPYQLAAAMGLSYGQWTNVGVGGITSGYMNTKAPTDLAGIPAVTGKPMRICAFEYYNQKANSAASIESAFQAYAARVRAYANTKLVWGTSTSSGSDPDSTRASYDTWCDSNAASYCDAYVALHNETHIGVSGSFAANFGTGLNLFFNDPHPNAAGNAFLFPPFQTALGTF